MRASLDGSAAQPARWARTGLLMSAHFISPEQSRRRSASTVEGVAGLDPRRSPKRRLMSLISFTNAK